MRYLWIVMCSTTLLMGCATTAEQKKSSLWQKWSKKDNTAEVEKVAAQSNSLLPAVDLSQQPGFTDQYRVGKFSVGAWVNQNPGQLFQKVTARHPDAALVYMYRPASRWNRQEIVAPNFFLNGERIPSLLDNHYYWIELPAGSYRLNTTHPLGAIHFQKPKLLDFDVEAGQTYFIKYEEQGFRTGGSYAKPLYLMAEEIGLKEIMTTQLKTPGLSYIKYDEMVTTPLDDNIHQVPYQSVNKAQLSEKHNVSLRTPFKLWNPLTW